MFTKRLIQRVFFILGAVSLLFMSCEKEEEMNKRQFSPLGTFTAEATLNDTSQWEANGVYGNFLSGRDTMDITFGNYANEYCLIERIGFDNIQLKLDAQNLNYIDPGEVKYSTQPTAYYLALDCDATGEEYYLHEEEQVNNYIKINDIEHKESGGSITEIQGVFQMTLVRDTVIPKIIFPDRPDTLRMTDGSFSAEIRRSE